MEQVVKHYKGFEFVIGNEFGSDGSSYYSEMRSYEQDKLSVEFWIKDFLSLSYDEIDEIKKWLVERAEINLRALQQKQDERYAEEERLRSIRHREEKANKKQTNKPGFVYLVWADNNLHKIGKAKNVDARVTEFGIKLPVKTSLIHSFKSDHYDLAELFLHKKFEGKREHGEWFRLDQEDIDYICSIQDGQI